MLRRLFCILIIPGLVAACASQQTAQTSTDTPAPTATIEQTPNELVSVLTNRYNVARTGANLNEVVLNVENVNSDEFGKLFTREVVGHIYAQPLYVPQVEIPDKGIHNVVYVATMHNMVYAFDADDSEQGDPLWEVNLGTPFTEHVFYDVPGNEHGVLSTPVIDPETQTIYLVSRISDDGQAVFKLHALDIRTGEPKYGSPKIIELSMPGHGIQNINGVVYLEPNFTLQRTGLLLFGGKIYFGFSSQNDQDWWFGWLPAYDANTLELTSLFNVAPDGKWGGNGGIWMAGSGIVADDTYLYFTAGNGPFDADTGGRSYANSVLKLQQQADEIKVVDWFTPSNWNDMATIDADMGSTGTILIEDMDLLIVGAKDDNLYLVDRKDMGHFDPEKNANLQTLRAGDGRMYVTPVYWSNGPGGKPTVYSWTEYDALRAFTLDPETRTLVDEPSSISPLKAVGMPLGSLALSSNGTDPKTGILWALYAPYADKQDGTGVLVALDATDLNNLLWSSDINNERDAIGLLAKFNPATVANGKVYVASFSDRLNVYGLLDN